MSTRKFVSSSLSVCLATCLAFGLLGKVASAGPVDINHADAATIAKELNGIGPAHAKAIVEYREKNGGFKTADELRKVKGIGAKVIERNRANIRTAAISDAPKKQ